MTIIPIYDTLLLPEVTFYFKKEVIDGWNAKELKPSETIAFIMLKRDISIDEAKPEDFYPVGIAAKLENIDNEGNIRIRTMNRILFEDVRIKKTKILATIDERPEVDDFSVEERTEVFERLKAEYLKFVQNFQWGLWARGFILQWKNMNELACAMAGYFSITWEEKYSIIEADSLEQRYRLIETAAYEFMEMAIVQSGAEDAQKEEHEKIYRENAIRKQIDILQKELEEMHPESISDISKFRKMIDESGMNETARKEAEKVLNRMKQEGQDGHEYGMLYDYLDFVTGLSWKPAEATEINIEKAEEILDSEHYGLKKVKERIIQQMAVMALNKKQSGSILLCRCTRNR